MPGKSKRKGIPKAEGKGRALLLTPELHKQLIEDVEVVGMIEAEAARANGIDPSTLSRWKTRGREAVKNWEELTPAKRQEEARYKDFFIALRDAEPKFERSNLVTISLAAAKGDWRAAECRLRIRFPERYGKRVMIAGDPKNPTPIPTSVAAPKMTDQEANERAARVLAAHQAAKAPQPPAAPRAGA